jgi:hypothetical protein
MVSFTVMQSKIKNKNNSLQTLYVVQETKHVYGIIELHITIDNEIIFIYKQRKSVTLNVHCDKISNTLLKQICTILFLGQVVQYVSCPTLLTSWLIQYHYTNAVTNVLTVFLLLIKYLSNTKDTLGLRPYTCYRFYQLPA